MRDRPPFLAAAIVLLAGCVCVADDPTGRVKGRITFDGDPPRRSFLVRNGRHPGGRRAKDATCFPKHVPDESLVVDPKTKGIANVFVYLRRRPENLPAAVVPKEPVVVSMREGRFQPHAVFVRVGQRLQLDQVDTCPHNAHVFTIKNPAVGYLLPPKGKSPGRAYSESEILPVPLRCDIHWWMSGHVLILDHSYAAITDAEGRFEIEGLPPGEHSFRVWHERAGYLEKSLRVDVASGRTSDVGTRSFPKTEFE